MISMCDVRLRAERKQEAFVFFTCFSFFLLDNYHYYHPFSPPGGLLDDSLRVRLSLWPSLGGRMSADEQNHSKQLDRSGGGEREACACVCVGFISPFSLRLTHEHTRQCSVLIPIIAISENYLKMQLREAVPHSVSSAGENWGKRAKAKRKRNNKSFQELLLPDPFVLRSGRRRACRNHLG